jgi:hypothetical protein
MASFDVFQIRASRQATAYFNSTCLHVDLPVKKLILWVKTRWASLSVFLERFLELKKASPVLFLIQIC